MNDPGGAGQLAPQSTSPLPLLDAMLAWGEPELVSEMLKLKKQGAEAPIWIMEGSPHNQRKGRYDEVRELVERSLLDRLVSGELVAHGYDSDSAFDEPMIRIAADRWRVLTPDFDESTAISGEREIVGIVVSLRDETVSAPALIASRAAIPNGAGAVRLVISADTKAVTLDGDSVTLTPQSTSLLLLLARAAQGGSGPVTNKDIEKHLWSVPPDERAVSHAVRVLRRQLRDAGLNGSRFVKNRNRVGYFLDVRPDTILILS